MTERLRERVNEAANGEYALAARRHGASFRSAREGYRVIAEEVQEARDEVDEMTDLVKDLRTCLRTNEAALIRQCAGKLRRAAVWTACEAIQVAVMTQKLLATPSEEASD